MSVPPENTGAGDPNQRPARVLMNSPLAVSTRVIAARRRTRERPRDRWLRVLAMVFALLVHLMFLVIFSFGSPYEPEPPPEAKVVALHVRLIDAPEPPPPPPVRGTPPKEKGPRHKGHASQRVAVSRHASPRSSEPSSMAVAQASPVTAPPVVAQVTKSQAPVSKPVAAPPPPISLPKPSPTPELQPVTVSATPPPVVLATPTLQPPVPPKFQPEPVRAPQAEGNQPMPPPASLAMSDVPAQAMPSVDRPTVALSITVPKSLPSPSVTPADAELSVAPPVPYKQVLPLPAQPAPTVNLKAADTKPAPSAPRELPQIQAPTAAPQEAQLEAVPLSPASKPDVTVTAPTIKIDVADKASVSAIQTSIPKAALSPPVETPTAADAPSTANTKAAESPDKSTADKSADKPSAESSPSTSPAASQSQDSNEHDVSSAPDATPQGSDTDTPGQRNGVADAAQTDGKQGTQASPSHGQGADTSASDAGKAAGTGKAAPGLAGTPSGDNQSQNPADQQGAIGSYVQVTPHGDTKIMDHRAPNIGYKSTRFNDDWTPLDESSVDTALRHAVEKTSVAHTFHLPRGVRIKCAINPLLPMALLACGNGDPPPAPVADKVYDRMHLAPANPLAPPAPAPASSTSVAKAPIKFDNDAECAAARISGGPPPPGCQPLTLPVKLAHPASPSSSGSWVPASDQFH